MLQQLKSDCVKFLHTLSVFQIAIIISVIVHAIPLTMHFTSPAKSNIPDAAPPLEIVLVNSKSPTKPHKADALAQANLDGGGNTDADRRAKTSMPKLQNEQTAELITQQRQVEQLEREAKRLMAKLKAQKSVEQTQPRPDPTPKKVDTPDAAELVQRSLEAIRLEAQISRDNDAYQKRPKRRFIGARTQEFRDAMYVDAWRTKVERIGNINYPEAARQQKLYGTLKLTVSIRADGSVEKIEINQTSHKKILDEAAKRIVELAAPYAPFPPEILRDTDILSITRTWTFSRSDELFTE